MRAAITLATVGVALTLGGCASRPSVPPAGSDAEAGVGLAFGYGSMRCVDPTNGSPPIDLVAVALRRPPGRSPGLTVDFRLAGPLRLPTPQMDFDVGLFARSGAPREVLTVRLEGGRARLLAYTPATGQEAVVSGRPAVSGASITAAFAVDPAAVAGAGWRWKALVVVDGSSTDPCPDP